ncbi:MAG: NAD-dependent epimerase/dehydratase family protein [Leptolyngbyaceae cyanobacterium SM1_4_3]|nr:NAD-dependent epimerase/dehydratase family protein [Leptolyngbyaceae cyanobacterium SM1_4_3]
MNSEKKVVLVSGVAGFIGRYVARYFTQNQWSVVGIDSSPKENAPLASLHSYHQMRLPDFQLGELLQHCQPQVYIHCIGRASVNLSMVNPDADFYGNVVPTFEVLNAIRLHAPDCRSIFLSSAAVYGDPSCLPVSEDHAIQPLSPYGFHKWQGEQLCLEFSKIYGLATASARIFSAYGPGLRRQVIWDICQQVISQKSLHLQGTGKESRDFIHALDIAQALSLICEKAPLQGEAYNLGSGREISILELSTLVLDVLDCDCSPSFNNIVAEGNPRNWRADISRSKALGFLPSVLFEQGIKTFALWCRAELLGV